VTDCKIVASQPQAANRSRSGKFQNDPFYVYQSMNVETPAAAQNGGYFALPNICGRLEGDAEYHLRVGSRS
jgi:hypothetical protein